jgi:hypothetical protein
LRIETDLVNMLVGFFFVAIYAILHVSQSHEGNDIDINVLGPLVIYFYFWSNVLCSRYCKTQHFHLAANLDCQSDLDLNQIAYFAAIYSTFVVDKTTVDCNMLSN